MSTLKEVQDKLTQHMEKAVAGLKHELGRMRTGRASSALLDTIHVDYYGSMVPLSQVANVTTPDARTLQIVPWEAQILGGIEKSILAANLGFTPQSDGKLIRITLPALTQERRKEMVKSIKKMGEDCKVLVRNNRRDGNDEIKKIEKSKLISEDEGKKAMDWVQKKTDEKVGEIDKIIAAKEKEVLTV